MGFETAEIGNTAPAQSTTEPSSRLEVYVLFTDIRSTLRALRTAAQLSRGLGSRIRLLLLETVPYPLPLNEPRRNLQFLGRRFRTVLEGYPVETACRSIETVAEIVLCRNGCEGLCQRLSPGSVVVIGKRDAWWPCKEDRWAKRLRQAGHYVVRTSAPAPLSLTNIFFKGVAHA